MWRFGTISGIRPGAGAWSSTSASPMTGLGRPATCSRTGACRTLKIWMRRCVLLRSVVAYQQQGVHADNQNISFLPAIVSTSTRMHGEFLRLLFLQAHRETEAHFTAAGMSSQTNNSEALRFKCAAFYIGLKSKVGLAAAKAAALRVNLNVQGCVIVAPPLHAPSRTPPPSFTQSPYPPRSLVRDGQTHPHRPRLVVSHSTCPPLSSPPHAHSFVIGPAVIKHTHNHAAKEI